MKTFILTSGSHKYFYRLHLRRVRNFRKIKNLYVNNEID